MIGNLQYHGNHQKFVFNNRMNEWESESDKISIGSVYKFLDNESEMKECTIIERVNFYSFRVIVNNIETIIPIERLKNYFIE